MKIKSSTSKVTPGFEGFSAEKSETDLPNTTPEPNNRGKSKKAFMSRNSVRICDPNRPPLEACEPLGKLQATAAEARQPVVKEVRQPVVKSHRAVTALKLVEPILYTSNDLIGLQNDIGIHIAENEGLWPAGQRTDIQDEEYSLAAALIQHATGQYKDEKYSAQESETTTRTVQQNLEIVLKKLGESPSSPTPRVDTIIRSIAERTNCALCNIKK
jgi:hypothetical protein